MAIINKDALKIGVTFVPCEGCDRIEVIYCKDCQYHQEDRICTHGIRGVGYKKTTDTDFCSFGERK